MRQNRLGSIFSNIVYRRSWKRFTAVLAIIVALATLASLTLPAITASQNDRVTPGHIHSSACYKPSDERVLSCNYEALGVHSHSISCFDVDGNLVCGRADYAVHTHDRQCFAQDGTLVCNLPEVAAHSHTADCYPKDAVCHTHDENCYKDEALVCELDEGYDLAPLCGKEDVALHTHGDVCYDGKVLKCEELAVFSHTHGEACYTEGEPVLTCGFTSTPVSQYKPVTPNKELSTFPVDFYILLNDEWELVHSTVGTRHGVSDGVDSVAIKELEEAFGGDYGYAGVLDSHLKFVYELKGGDATEVYTSGGYFDVGDKVVVALGDNVNGYNIYYTPANDKVYTGSSGSMAPASMLATSALATSGTLSSITTKANTYYDVYVHYNGLNPDYSAVKAYVNDNEIGVNDSTGKMSVLSGATVRVTGLTSNSYGYLRFNYDTTNVNSDYTYPNFTFEELANTASVTEVSLANITCKTYLHKLIRRDPVPSRADGDVAKDAISPIFANCYAMIDDKWQEVGKIFTGWRYGDATVNRTTDTNDNRKITYDLTATTTKTLNYTDRNTRDRVQMRNIQEIYKDYGFVGFSNSTTVRAPENGIYSTFDAFTTIAYQRLNSSGVYCDSMRVYVYYDNAASATTTYSLSTSGTNGKTVPAYNIFWLPGNYLHYACNSDGNFNSTTANLKNNTINSDVVNGDGKSHVLGKISKQGTSDPVDEVNDGSVSNYFYSVTQQGQTPTNANVTQKGGSISITVDGEESDWIVTHSDGTIGNPFGKNNNDTSRYNAYTTTTVEENGVKRTTYNFTNVTRQLILVPNENKDWDNLADSVPLNYYVNIDGEWTLVGTTTTGIRDLASLTTTEPIPRAVGDLHIRLSGTALHSDGRVYDFVTTAQAEKILGEYGFKASDYVYLADTAGARKYQSNSGYYPLRFTIENAATTGVHTGSRTASPITLTTGEQGFMMYVDNRAALHNTTYSIYYTPLSTVNNATSYNKNNITFGNANITVDQYAFFTVNVVDDKNLVYNKATQAAFRSKPYFYGTAGAAITPYDLTNKTGYTWGILSVPTRNTVSADGKSTHIQFTVPIEETWNITLSAVNPSFTVEYYGDVISYNLESSKPSGSTALPVIDTTVSGLPTNDQGVAGTTNPYNVKYLTLDTTTNQYKVDSTLKENVKLYEASTYQFEKQPGVYYVDKLRENDGYVPERIGIKLPGESSFKWFYFNAGADNVYFTNDRAMQTTLTGVATKDIINYIYIADSSTLRIDYDNADGIYTNSANFYDYDLSNGGNANGIYNYAVREINHPQKYERIMGGDVYKYYGDTGVSVGFQRNDYPGNVGESVDNMYGFGNGGNTPTGLGAAEWTYSGETMYLNRYNSSNSEVEGCCFEIARGYNPADMNLLWNYQIQAPRDLFKVNTNRDGKFCMSGGSLTFNRVGNTYTLTGAHAGSITNGGTTYKMPSLSNLEYFSKVKNGDISNSFWAVDMDYGQNDPLHRDSVKSGAETITTTQEMKGVTGYTPKLNSSLTAAPDNVVGASGKTWGFPGSDDGKLHNYFFGMCATMNFTLTEDYVAPLNYLFFGDDDLWVFLTHPDGRQELICDIGGIHISVGEYVDLWDYIDKGSAGEYTLAFFYTERGGSGSSCWMSFNLPSVTASSVGAATANAALSKEVIYPDGTQGDATILASTSFNFVVKLYNDNKMAGVLLNTYAYHVNDASGNLVNSATLKDGSTIRLTHGQRLTILNLPVGAYVVFRETGPPGYTISASTKVETTDAGGNVTTTGQTNLGNTNSASLSIAEENKTYVADFVNTVKLELPATGGVGTTLYTISGLLLVITAAALLYINRKKAKGGVVSN